MGLASYKQIRFLPIAGTFGNYTLVINSPGNNDLTQSSADTLLLTEGSPEDYYPFIIAGELQLSKKFTTTKGRRAVDDLTLGIRDGFGYTGTDGAGTPVASENFLSIYQTFFDVWFTGVLPYKAFLLYHNHSPNLSEVAHEGWIDPTYKPSTDAYVINPGTSEQIWLGTRTIKITSFSQAQLALTWQSVLATIGPSDCQEGVPYNGYMFAPSGCDSRTNTRQTAFGGGVGYWYQAVPYIHKYSATNDPILVGLPAAVWPSPAWTTGLANKINSYSGASGGSGYAPGDTFTVDGGTTLATGVVHAVGGGGTIVSLADAPLTFTGGGYTTGVHATTATSGGGSGFSINIISLSSLGSWGPTGSVFIKIGTLFSKVASKLGLATFTPSTDLKSALSFWAQKALESGSQKCFPIDNVAAIPLDEIYISLNVFAKSHPYDGSYWDNPVGFNAETPISDVITGLCNFLLSDFNETYASGGASTLKLTPMGTPGALLPADWQIVGTPSEEEPSTGSRVININNRGDDLKIQSPLGIVGDISTIEIPIRLHRIAQTSGNNPVNDSECVTWDSSKSIQDQAEECFKVAWIDVNGNAAINPNCWKGMCYAYWFNASNTNVVYPSNWNPFPKNDGSAGSWANSFYVINACYKSGATPPANLLAEIQGDSYFNSRDYPAVAFAALTLSSDSLQSFEYFGVVDSTGSVQNIGAGMAGQWRLAANPSQNWRGIEIAQLLLSGGASVKWQSQLGSGTFPNIYDLTHGVVGGTGGTSSTTGGNTQTGGVAIPPSALSWHPIQLSLITGAGVIALSGYDNAYLCTDATTTGVTAPSVESPKMIVITNKTGADFTAGNFFIANNDTWALYYDGTATQSDPTLPAGWNIFGHSS